MSLTVLANHITEELNKSVVQGAASGVFVDENLRAQFVGTKKVTLPSLTMSGLGNYSRDNGFAAGSMSVSSDLLTLSMDRGRSFLLDREDNDEVGVVNLAGQVMGEFVRTKVIPEMDAYVFSKLATYALDHSQTVTGTLATESYKMLCDAVNKVQDKIGYDEPIVAFVNGNFWKALQGSSALTKTISAGNFDGNAHTLIHSLNGMPIIPVVNDRMMSEYTFLDGTTSGQTAGGFTPTEDADNVGLIVCPKRAASLVRKTDQVRVFDPDHNLDADAWKFDYRLYYDCFIRPEMANAIYVYAY